MELLPFPFFYYLNQFTLNNRLGMLKRVLKCSLCRLPPLLFCNSAFCWGNNDATPDSIFNQ